MPTANTVYSALKTAGINTYWMTQAPSPLTKRGVVVKNSDDDPMMGSDVLGSEYIELDVCVPASRYGELDAFIREVKKTLSDVGGLRYNGAGPSWGDDDMRSSIRTIEYRLLKRYR